MSGGFRYGIKNNSCVALTEMLKRELLKICKYSKKERLALSHPTPPLIKRALWIEVKVVPSSVSIGEPLHCTIILIILSLAISIF